MESHVRRELEASLARATFEEQGRMWQQQSLHLRFSTPRPGKAGNFRHIGREYRGHAGSMIDLERVATAGVPQSGLGTQYTCRLVDDQVQCCLERQISGVEYETKITWLRLGPFLQLPDHILIVRGKLNIRQGTRCQQRIRKPSRLMSCILLRGWPPEIGEQYPVI